MKPQQEIKSNIPKNAIFIAGNVPSLKNSKQIFRTRNGKPFITSSKLCKDYEKATINEYMVKGHNFSLLHNEEYPLKVKFYFVRDSKRKFDYVNVCQIVLDLMVKTHWLSDDNADEVIPIFEGYHVDKNNAGVYIYF